MTATANPPDLTATPPDLTAPPPIAGLAGFVEFLETGQAPSGLFAEELFADLSFPHWRVQTTTAADLLATRRTRHPWPGRVRVERADRTDTGFAVALEERWHAEEQHWYCREFFRADVIDGRIVELAVMCTGDWDEALQRRHAQVVTLTRP